MIVTDASLWVSRFLTDDAFHEATVAWMAKTLRSATPIFVPVTMLAEVAGAISRRTGNTHLGYEIAQHIRQLPTLNVITVDADLGDFAAEVASTHRLRGADAIYVALAHQLQMALVSWDQEQIARSANLIRAATPT